MSTLVIGSGGREHALCWKLAQAGEVHCAPGNPGVKLVATCHPVATTDHQGLLDLSNRLRPDIIVVGPEEPLILGLADRLRAGGHTVFGPGADGARLEGSKAWSKELMLAAGVPTATSVTCIDAAIAKEVAQRFFDRGVGVAVKASGAALGKGVVVCDELELAIGAIHEFMVAGSLGEAGRTLVIEEKLGGREFSLLTLVNERGLFSLPVAQDHKRQLDGDQGPNTGGMGTFAPAGWVSADLVAATEDKVVRPLLTELARRGVGYQGVLFSGLMVSEGRLDCLEYNVRFGDPETQSVVRVLGDGLRPALLACARGEEIPPIESNGWSAVTVVMASAGYPGPYETGATIRIGETPPGVEVFHAGTAREGDRLVTKGGRVLGISATGATLAEARASAYRGVDGVSFAGAQWRSDIGLG